ncbi:hypothetical protein J3R82DRAFT_5119 [Butyriboletus roseoflavus]|nr:hypothetical protein J3R82DRAFT_5119 [Butyriboletus roseoflavus]
MASPSGIGLALVTILSTSIECILYGISFVMFGGTVWALTHGRPKAEINWSMVLVASILTILSTIHVTVDIQRLVDGFVTEADIPGGPTVFFADVTQRTFLIKCVVYVLQTLLGDAVVTYRCYVVWHRFTIVLLPVVLWCATFVISVGMIYHTMHATDIEDVLLLNINGNWVIPFYVLTMATNALSSALLAYRIWTMNRNVPGVIRVLSRSGVEAKLLFRVLIDSALLYTLTLFALLTCYAYQNTGQFIVLDMMTPIISITFYTVLVRIAMARNNTPRPPPAVLSPLRFAVRVVPSPLEPAFSGARRSSI